MEVYLNVIETGKGIYGVEKLLLSIFIKKQRSIPWGSFTISSSLPSPIKYSVTNPGPYMKSRQSQIMELMDKIET
jgi:monofunctional biosynthetic peptidoglycan transglycosylase